MSYFSSLNILDSTFYCTALRSLLIFGLSAASVSAQTQMWQWFDPDNDDYFCGSWRGCAIIGDLNSDGVPDIAVGASLKKVDGAYTGAVYVFSGTTGAILATWLGPPNYYIGGTVAPAGDLDDDGVPDLFITAGFDQTHWISGATGSLTYLSPKGGWITSPGDIDLDGARDFVASQYGLGIDTRAFSGKTGQLLWVRPGISGNISSIGDLNSDGVEEVIVGRAVSQGPDRATVLSGKTGVILFDYTDTSFGNGQFGYFHSGSGDITGDGVVDFAIGNLNTGKVIHYSGATGTKFWEVPLSYNSVHNVGDIDGDGVNDLMHYTFPTILFSGRTHQSIYTIPPLYGWGDYGQIVEIDGDDCPDFFDIYYNASAAQPGRIRAFSGMPVGAKSVGTGLPNSEGDVPRIGISSVPKSNKPLAVNLSRVAPGTQAWLVVGDATDPINFPGLESRLGIPPQALLVNANELFPVTAYAVAPGKGSATVELLLPPSSVGMKFRTEWIVMNPLGTPAPVSLSRALEITIQP